MRPQSHGSKGVRGDSTWLQRSSAKGAPLCYLHCSLLTHVIHSRLLAQEAFVLLVATLDAEPAVGLVRTLGHARAVEGTERTQQSDMRTVTRQ